MTEPDWRGLNVTFLNVGQGDSTYLRHPEHDWAALIDGGWGHKIERHLPWLRTEASHIDLLVGTHCDGDHLEGLCVLVEDCDSPGIRTALLPPFVHPTGALVAHRGLDGVMPGRSPFAAHHVGYHGAKAVMRPLEELVSRVELANRIARAAKELGSELEEYPPVEQSSLDDDADLFGVAGDEDDDGGEGGDPPLDLHTGGLRLEEFSTDRLDRLANIASELKAPATAETIHALALLSKKVSLAAASARFAPGFSAKAMPALRAGGPALATVRASLEVVADVSTLSYLERLIQALDARKIPWFVRPAPPFAASEGTLVETWHIAPTERYLNELARYLPVVKERLLIANYVNPRLPSFSNRLSHVLAFRGHGERVGVMVTGDAGFQRRRRGRRESMSSGWGRTLPWARLVDIPHHGGSYGSFGKRLREELQKYAPNRQLDLYVSVGHPNSHAPPHDRFHDLLPYVAAACSSVRLRMSALPRPAALGEPWRSRVVPSGKSVGPERVELCQCHGSWCERDAGAALTLWA